MGEHIHKIINPPTRRIKISIVPDLHFTLVMSLFSKRYLIYN